jgi:hypothetical protein
LIQPDRCSIGCCPGHCQQAIPLAFSQRIERIRAGQPFLGLTVDDLSLAQKPSHRFVAHGTDMVEKGGNRFSQAL